VILYTKKKSRIRLRNIDIKRTCKIAPGSTLAPSIITVFEIRAFSPTVQFALSATFVKLVFSLTEQLAPMMQSFI
jgi:hypothetical protein